MQEIAEESDPMAPSHPGGEGVPRVCSWKGESKPFHDGGGWGSPGRWKKEKRLFPGGLGFAALALPWTKPFLGPLYAWFCAIQGTEEG